MKKNLNNNGSALTMVLLASIALAGVSLIYLNRMKINQRIAMKSSGDNEIDAAMLQISTLLLNPKHCNATFTGQPKPPLDASTPPAGTPLDDIKTCSSGNCLTATGRVISFPKVLTTNTSWTSTVTGFQGSQQGATAPTSKIRLNKINYWLQSDQTYGTGTGGLPAVVRLELTFERQIGTTSVQTATPNVFDTTIKTAMIPRSMFIPVLVGSYNSATGVYTGSSTILGCPKSPSSTIRYDAP